MATDNEIIATAEAAGLGRAVAECREDVIAAARSAETFRAGLGDRSEPRVEPTSEPWPPMRVKVPS